MNSNSSVTLSTTATLEKKILIFKMNFIFILQNTINIVSHYEVECRFQDGVVYELQSTRVSTRVSID